MCTFYTFNPNENGYAVCINCISKPYKTWDVEDRALASHSQDLFLAGGLKGKVSL